MYRIGTQVEPLVSVTVPTYNRPDYLRQALGSAVKQTYRNIEIIVSDNASPQSALSVVQEFDDPRIRFVRHETPLTMFGNHMYGFRNAKGKYVASLHDDDIWKENFLEKLVPMLEADSDLIVAFCSQWVIDQNSQVSEARTQHYNAAIGRANLRSGLYQPFMELALQKLAIQPASSAVIRREAIDWHAVPEHVGPMWDVYLSYKMASTGMEAYFLNEKLTFYRIHGQSDTGKTPSLKDKMNAAVFQMACYSQILQEDEESKVLSEALREHIRHRWQHACTSVGIALMKLKRIREARKYFVQAMEESLLDSRTWAAYGLSLMPPPSQPLRKWLLDVTVKARA